MSYCFCYLIWTIILLSFWYPVPQDTNDNLSGFFFNCFIYEKNFIDDRNLGIQMTINFNTENTLWSYRCTLLICPVPINAKLMSFTIKLNYTGTKHKSLFNTYLTTSQNYFTFFWQYWLTYFLLSLLCYLIVIEMSNNYNSSNCILWFLINNIFTLIIYCPVTFS